MKPVAAVIAHACTGRLRIRVPDRRGDLRYFENVRKAALKSSIEVIRVNAFTGSILFHGRQATESAVAEFGSVNDLFAIYAALPAPSLAKRISAPLTTCNRSLQQWSAGQIDLPGAFFILLLFIALFEIARGRFRTPPWYTAFWYAFGLFTKALIDREPGDHLQKTSDAY